VAAGHPRYVALVAADSDLRDLRVTPELLGGFAQALHGGADDLRIRLAELDGQVGDMLSGWRGASGRAYSSAWELWHRGAGEVELGLSMLARLVTQAGLRYRNDDAGRARVLRQLGTGAEE
jgi:WXG100 family type VII secretion target